MTFYNLLSNLWTIRIPFHQFLIILNLFTRFFVSRSPSLYFAARLTLLTPDRTDKMFKKKRILTENMRHVLKIFRYLKESQGLSLILMWIFTFVQSFLEELLGIFF